jgi:TatD DNase family protein
VDVRGQPFGRDQKAATEIMTWYVDSHCHLGLFPQPTQILDAAPGTVVVAVTELPSQYRLTEARFRQDRRVRVALGLHPLRAASAGPFEEGQFGRLLSSTEYVGEIGLDFSRSGRGTQSAQLRILDRLLAESLLRYKVISVHSRGAEAVTIRKLDEAGVTAILHWYTGPTRFVDDALSAGLYFSINPAMLRSEKGKELIAALPQDRVLTESDGPFGKFRGHETAPNDVSSVVEQLAERWNDDPASVRNRLYKNFAVLYAATVGRAPKST